MENNLLYFPYINVPNDSWTTKSILYWDQVAAIVPESYRNNPNDFEQNMLGLVREGLIQQIFPRDYVERIPNFDDAFIELTDAANFDLGQRQVDFQNGNVSRLNVQKFGDRLLRRLVRMRIAEQYDWQWYYVESRTARLFMMYLATLISQVGNYTPATDKVRNIDFSIQQRGPSYYMNRTRGKLLNDLMPYPINPDPVKLQKFKRSHRKQLISFRNLLEQTIIEITAINSQEQREALYELKLSEINDRKEELYSKLTESKVGQILFGSVFSITGAAYGFSTGNLPIGAIGLTNAIYSALQGYSKKEVLEDNLVYLALIDKKFNRRS